MMPPSADAAVRVKRTSIQAAPAPNMLGSELLVLAGSVVAQGFQRADVACDRR
jgi:hypothetical protein